MPPSPPSLGEQLESEHSTSRAETAPTGIAIDNEYPFPVLSKEDVSTRLLEGREHNDGRLEDNVDAEDDDEYKPSRSSVEWSSMTGSTPLDDTLEALGMGRYQKSLLVLCGFGWMADNMWLQCVAVILPRVQEHYGVSDRWIGLLSASIFSGMMVGAWGWGSYSDVRGRRPAFNLTLLLTSVFGVLSAVAPTFELLCLALFGLGVGVGGSMPTDGTLFLENIPKTRHYLLTALSAFFSIGAVLTSILGLVIIPSHSCPEHPLDGEVCDVEAQNRGWRYMLATLAAVSISMCLSRILFFRLHESPKYLVSAGRSSEAVIALQEISRFNGNPTTYDIADVVDSHSHISLSPPVLNDYGTPSPGSRPSMSRPRAHYPPINDEEADAIGVQAMPSKRPGWWARLPKGLAATLEDNVARVEELFEPKWARTTKLVWLIWGFCSAGYTIFNVFLPKFLETKIGEEAGSGGRSESLRDYVVYTISGLPGSLLGAYLVETSWGSKGTMAVSTLATALGTFVFVLVSSQAGVVITSMVISLAATLMYAVIYSYTPSAFAPSVRGTACGIASAFSRLAGIVAPVLTGLMLSIHVSLPLFVSAGCFAITATAMVMLPAENRGQPKVAMSH